MKPITIRLLFAVLVGSLLAGGCAKPPTVEMNAATEAVTRAENDEDAALYAGNTLARARDALKRMQMEANSKRYDAAKTYAAEAIAASDKALADGRAGAVRAREEALTLVSELRPTIVETEQEIEKAQLSQLDLDFEAIEENLDAARRDTDQAESALAGNRYQDAIDKGRTARAGLSDINQRLAATATAVSRKK